MKSEKVEFVETGWGGKEPIINIEEYCAMIINFKKAMVSSVHYHHEKLETYYVLEGRIELRIAEDIEEYKKQTGTHVLPFTKERINPPANYVEHLTGYVVEKGHRFVVPPNTVHQVVALEDSRVLEISTQHLESDMFRLVLGD
jgi:quercetin dioxygenase-like cupin family protein